MTLPLSVFNGTTSGFELSDFKAESLDLDKLGLGGLDCCKMVAVLYLVGSSMVRWSLTRAHFTSVIMFSVVICLGAGSKLEPFDSIETSPGDSR
ncbi:hypothetical protein Trydic_g22625 [Trypoxylus dichotomus]